MSEMKALAQSGIASLSSQNVFALDQVTVVLILLMRIINIPGLPGKMDIKMMYVWQM